MAARYLNGNLDPVGDAWVTVYETSSSSKVPVGGFSLFEGGKYLMLVSRALISSTEGLTDGEVYGRFLDKSGCVFTLSPTSKAFSFNGGAVVVRVTSRFSCPTPDVLEDYDWLTPTVLNWNTAKGSGMIKLTAVKNTSSVTKPSPSSPGIVTIGGEPFLVTLAGKPCAITGLTPALQLVPNTGNPYSLAVKVDPTDCGWQATASTSWLHIGALGVATLAYTVDPNTATGATARIGTVTVSLTGNPARKRVTTIRQAK